MVEEIEDLIHEVDEAINYSTSSKYSYSPAVLELLPDIKGGLEYIRRSLTNDPPDIHSARGGVSGLGRVTLEYVEFYESELGLRILELTDKLREELDPLLENPEDQKGHSKL